ncbi:six-hairpin glycosidase, partial [Lasius niger]
HKNPILLLTPSGHNLTSPHPSSPHLTLRSVEKGITKEVPWSDREDRMAREASPASSKGTRTPRYKTVQKLTEPEEDGVQKMATFLERISDSEDSEVQMRGDDEPKKRPKS